MPFIHSRDDIIHVTIPCAETGSSQGVRVCPLLDFVVLIAVQLCGRTREPGGQDGEAPEEGASLPTLIRR